MEPDMDFQASEPRQTPPFGQDKNQLPPETETDTPSDDLEVRGVTWGRSADGRLRSTIAVDHEADFIFEVEEEPEGLFLRVIEGDHEIKLQALHGGLTSLTLQKELLHWRCDRRALIPEATDADAYALAAADFQEVFFKGETPELFFQLTSQPGMPRRIHMELLGLSHLAGNYMAELLVYDRNDQPISPMDPKTGDAMPIVPQRLEFASLGRGSLSSSGQQLMERCREAHPSATDLVRASLSWEIRGHLARGAWIVVRIRRVPEELAPTVEPAPSPLRLTPRADRTYLVERPAREWTGDGQSAHRAEGWLLETSQIEQIAQRRMMALGAILLPHVTERASVQLARQEAAISFTRELRRGTFNKSLTHEDEQAVAAAKATVRRKGLDQWRRQEGESLADRQQTIRQRGRSHCHPEEEPLWWMDREWAHFEFLEDFSAALRKIEPDPHHRVLVHACRMQREEGDPGVIEWAAEYFQIHPRKLYRYFAEIRAAFQSLDA